MPEILDTVLLLALPASGKSEVRRYLASIPPEACVRDFHMGPTVQLDDFPYVHLMRQIDLALKGAGLPAVFFEGPDRSFVERRDWGTLIELVNEDHDDLVNLRVIAPASAGEWLLERLDTCRVRVGAPPPFQARSPEVRQRLIDAIEEDARALLRDKHAAYPDTLDGKTVVIEFARGGKADAPMPLAAPYGYAYSLSRLSDRILSQAAILYVWVTPEESRRKNEARADPNDPGSILHHGVPMHVMLHDYGCDDMDHLIQTGDQPDHVRVEAHGRVFHLPVARFDNRVDKTSFVRDPRERWDPQDVRALHEGLATALVRLANLGGQ